MSVLLPDTCSNHGGQEKASAPLEPELTGICVQPSVCAGNQTWVLHKSSRCSYFSQLWLPNHFLIKNRFPLPPGETWNAHSMASTSLHSPVLSTSPLLIELIPALSLMGLFQLFQQAMLIFLRASTGLCSVLCLVDTCAPEGTVHKVHCFLRETMDYPFLSNINYPLSGTSF